MVLVPRALGIVNSQSENYETAVNFFHESIALSKEQHTSYQEGQDQDHNVRSHLLQLLGDFGVTRQLSLLL